MKILADAAAAFAYPDEVTALRALSSAGPVARATAVAGEDSVRDALRRSIVPFRRADGSIHTDNVWRFAIGRKASVAA